MSDQGRKVSRRLSVFAAILLVASFTARDVHVGWRAAAQAIITGILMFVMLPAVVLEHSGRSLWEAVQWPAWQQSLVFNALLLPVVLGLAGSQEFAERGHGTPIPFDPPKHLVVTGPYAYVANPMQMSVIGSLLILGLAFESWLLAAAAGVIALFLPPVTAQASWQAIKSDE